MLAQYGWIPDRGSLPGCGVRVHELEEQLKDQEAQAEHNMEEEGRRHREAFSKMERDKNTHLELLNNRYARTRARTHARTRTE